MEPSEQYLMDYLAEEFREHPRVRIRSMLEDNERGISVKTESRTYFFPYEWTAKGQFKKVQDLVRIIKEVHPSSLL